MIPAVDIGATTNDVLCIDDLHLPKLTRNQLKIYSKMRPLERAIGAYELLDLLRSDGVNAIPTVYRALDGLIQKGLVRHIVSTKTYVVLPEVDREQDDKVMLVCSNCQSVSVVDAPPTLKALKNNAEKSDFAVQEKHLEFLGLCYACNDKHHS